ncbi:MAG: PKD domain-containing protein, partial [Methanosarcina vacuolata]|nr:PKD domain-containing protein [Methanosarcina vacuolata]
DNHRIQKFDSNGNFITKWGSPSGSGIGDGQFDGPWSVSDDSSGNIYVADYDNHRIQKFDSNGNFITKWGSYGDSDGQFSNPSGVAVDSSGNVYVADTGNRRIQKFDSSGKFITQGFLGRDDSQLTLSEGIAVDSYSNVYVTDCYSGIQKFDSSGKYITQWGSPSWYWDMEENTEILVCSPQCVAVDSSGNVYVTDDSDQIQKFDSSGKFIAKWGSEGSGNGQFNNPHGVAVDSSGNVYVADSGNNRIQKFDSSGKFITKWGSAGSNEGQFNTPHGVAVDSSGNVYVADTYNNRIQKFVKVVSTQKPVASFSASPTSGKAPLTVAFTGKSTEVPTKWKWSFGDGKTSTVQNPTHKYSKVGSYTVKLTATNDKGSNTVTKKDYIKVVTKPVASFSAKPTSGKAPLTVAFTDKSTGIPTKWKWSFGDGKTSTEQNPKHKYLQEGKYKVTLTVTNVAGSNTTTKTNFITVTTNTRPGIYSEIGR